MAKVQLIDYTQDAAVKLIFTKATRLNMSASLLEEIKAHCQDPEWVATELAYMAKTIPSSWEFVSFTFLVTEVTRACTHQMVRTRHGSYAQQTMRLVNMDQFTYETGPTIKANPQAQFIYDQCMGEISAAYSRLTELGIPAEDARGVLPTNIHTNIVCEYNLRTFSELCKSRTGGRTQGEYASIVNLMADEVLKVYPWCEQFLFKQGRHSFDALEACAAEIKKFNPKLGYDALKELDLLRKE